MSVMDMRTAVGPDAHCLLSKKFILDDDAQFFWQVRTDCVPWLAKLRTEARICASAHLQ